LFGIDGKPFIHVGKFDLLPNSVVLNDDGRCSHLALLMMAFTNKAHQQQVVAKVDHAETVNSNVAKHTTNEVRIVAVIPQVNFGKMALPKSEGNNAKVNPH
jgi:hypothetical protein